MVLLYYYYLFSSRLAFTVITGGIDSTLKQAMETDVGLANQVLHVLLSFPAFLSFSSQLC